METLRKVCLDRRCEKDPVAKKSLSLVVFEAQQITRRKQADIRFRTATESVGRTTATRAPTMERLNADSNVERIVNLHGRTDIDPAHFLVACDPISMEPST